MATSYEVQLRQIDRRLITLRHVNHAILTIRKDKQYLLAQVCKIIGNEMGYSFVWLGELHSGQEIVDHASVGSFCENNQKFADQEAVVLLQRSIATAGPIIEHRRSQGPEEKAQFIAALHTPLTYSDIQQPVLGLIVTAGAEQESKRDDLLTLAEMLGDLSLAIDAIAIEERSRNAEAALRISEERFQRLAEHSSVGIVLIQNDLYRYVNPAFAQMFGFDTPAEIIDRLGPLDLTAPESRDIVTENVAKRVLGQVRAIRYQYRGLRKNGTAFDVEEHGTRTVHAQRLAIIATVIDVSAREASRHRLEALSQAGLTLARAQTPQEALSIAVDQVRSIFDCAAAVVVLSDQEELVVAAGSGNGDLIKTAAAQIRTGIKPNKATAVDPAVASSPSVMINTHGDQPSNDSQTESPLLAGAPPPVLRIQANVPLIVRGETIGVLVAEATAPQILSEENVQHLRLFADQVAATYQHLHLISRLEDERNRLSTLNRLSHTLSETLIMPEVVDRAVKETSHALQADISLLYLWDTNSASLTAAAAQGLTAEALAELNNQLQSAEGKAWITAVLTNTEVTGADSYRAIPPLDAACGNGLSPKNTCTLNQRLEARGELIGLLSFSRTLTHRFGEADAALVATLSVPIALAIQNAQLYEWISYQAETMSDALRRQEELDRMKDELIQNISHELRTPLGLVMGYAEMLASGRLGPIADQQADAINVIARRSRMLRSLVEDISLLWNIERREETRELLDLRETVQLGLSEFASQARERNLKLHGVWPQHPVIIVGVQVHVRRILDNLIGNSLKFTQPGGAIEVSLETEGDWAILSVSDTGIGVPHEQLERIFERFYQVDGSAKRRYGGTGLGLALVKAIVETHGGIIKATSPIAADYARPGTQITVRLPLARQNVQVKDVSRQPEGGTEITETLESTERAT